MDGGASPVLAARTTGQRTASQRIAGPGRVHGLPQPRTADAAQARPARRGRLHRLLAGFGDSCALAAVALLGCLGVVAVGTIGSLLWMTFLER